MWQIDRREFVRGGAAALMVVVTTAGNALAQQDAPQSWEEAVKRIVGETKPIDGRVTLDLPEIAENGNTVPFAVSVESPMTEKEYVKAIHIISTGNPQSGVATFRLTPQSGKAAVASRMRLARTQDIIALAELSDGKVLQARRSVKVTIGGCGG